MDKNTKDTFTENDRFHLIHTLIEPYRKLERLTSYESMLTSRIRSAQQTIHSAVKDTISKTFSRTLIGIIPFLIVFYVLLTHIHIGNDSVLMDVFDTMITDRFTPHTFIEGILFIVLLYGLLPCSVILLPIMLVSAIISTKRSVSRAREILKTGEEELPQVKTAIHELKEKLKRYNQFLPPSHLNSEALSFFWNSYQNYRVKTIGEAVNLYEEYLHQQYMEQTQEEILRKQIENAEQMASLSAEIASLGDTISSLESAVNDLPYYYW